jgi:DNA-binding NtrC family response regulator
MGTPTRSQGQQATVLVVDDDSAVAALCVAMLKQGGFKALSADGSSEALRICKEHQGQIDLLITDLVMPPPAFQLASSSNEFPHVHGHELAVRAVGLREGLRILIMSGNPDQELAAYGIKKGTFPFLQKPLELKAFLQTVHDVLVAPPPALSSSAPTSSDGSVEWYD